MTACIAHVLTMYPHDMQRRARHAVSNRVHRVHPWTGRRWRL